MRISRESLERDAAATGFRAEILEKVIHLFSLLDGFQKHPFLTGKWALKGGTALNTRAQFRRFMFAQSKPYPEMIELVAQLKVRYGLRIAVVSNEARELGESQPHRPRPKPTKIQAPTGAARMAAPATALKLPRRKHRG